MTKYSFAIPNAKTNSYRLISFFMLAINLLIFGYVFLIASGNNQKNLSLVGVFINGAGIAKFFLNNYSGTKNRKNFRVEIVFIISALLWLFIGKYVLAFMLLFFAVLGFYTNKQLIIYINENGIRYPSFPPKLLLWPAVEQVILKDDVLTIDMKDNRLLQFAIDKLNTLVIDETEFNKFCIIQLTVIPNAVKQS